MTCHELTLYYYLLNCSFYYITVGLLSTYTLFISTSLISASPFSFVDVLTNYPYHRSWVLQHTTNMTNANRAQEVCTWCTGFALPLHTATMGRVLIRLLLSLGCRRRSSFPSPAGGGSGCGRRPWDRAGLCTVLLCNNLREKS